MLKNRDTPSNPYRVPPQPTPGWVKACIVILFLFVFITAGAIIYLMIMWQQCPAACSPQRFEDGRGEKKKLPDKSVQMDDVSASRDREVRQQSSFMDLVDRMNRLNSVVAGLKSEVEELERRCSWSSEQDQPTGSSESLSPSDKAMLMKIPRIESETQSLQEKLTKHVTQEQQVCKEGHYRYGVYCYVIGDGSMTQSVAKQWCREDLGSHATLAIIKDGLTQKFLSTKLPQRSHTYWIGIEKQGSPSSLTSTSTSASNIAPSSYRSPPFEYVDGTRVQKSFWQTWRHRAEAVGSNRNAKQCAAMVFDGSTGQWGWEEKICSQNHGYICQYFIMTP